MSDEEKKLAFLANSNLYRMFLERLVDGEFCQYCGQAAQTYDHLWPRAQGGPDSTDNLVPVCRSCNANKSDSTLEEWIDRLSHSLEAAQTPERELRTHLRLRGARRALRMFPWPGIEPEPTLDEELQGLARCMEEAWGMEKGSIG